MELLVPSLAALLVAIAIAYFFIPRVAPTILVAVSSLVLAWALYSHYKQFGVVEYDRAGWMYSIRDYSGFILFAVILLGGFGFYVMNRKTSEPAPLMNLTVPTGGGMANVAKTVRSRMQELISKGRLTLD